MMKAKIENVRIMQNFTLSICSLCETRRMLMTVAVILIFLWLLGVVSSYTIGGFINLLLVVAIIMILVRLIRGENPIK